LLLAYCRATLPLVVDEYHIIKGCLAVCIDDEIGRNPAVLDEDDGVSFFFYWDGVPILTQRRMD
jgi:hypothetical protein